MQELEPPEVPLDNESQIGLLKEEPKKEGFFKKLFSKKSEQTPSTSSTNGLLDQDIPSIDMPALELPSDLTMDANSPVMMNLEIPDARNDDTVSNAFDNTVKKNSSKGKSQGKFKKGQKRFVSKIDESSQFDWTREIRDQEILIHDSNRTNQDVSALMAKADQHVEDKSVITSDNNFLSEHKEIQLNSESVNVPNINTQMTQSLPEISVQSSQTPMIDESQRKLFMKIASNHERIRKTLDKYLHNQKLFNNKSQVIELFKMYDESVEKNIEDKELELTKKKHHLEIFEKHLKEQEKEIKGLHTYMQQLDKKLKTREAELNQIISNAVEKDLTRRLKSEKKLLKEELKRTSSLNSDLKKKVKIIEDDKIRFEKEHTKLSENERKKLNELQSVYETKLSELETEKKIFEDRRKNSLGVLKHADNVAKELEDLKKMKEYVNTTKNAMDKEFVEDKELKQAIDKAESALQREKENLDKMIFSRYIDNKLKSIKPEYLETRQDWKSALKSNPLYGQITECRKLLSQRNITGAKSIYNDIRKSYEQVQATKKEKEALYTAIRELYNDIQLRMVEVQMRVK